MTAPYSEPLPFSVLARNYVDPEIAEKIDIGLAPPKKSRKEELLKQMEYLKSRKEDRELEKAARTLSCK